MKKIFTALRVILVSLACYIAHVLLSWVVSAAECKMFRSRSLKTPALAVWAQRVATRLVIFQLSLITTYSYKEEYMYVPSRAFGMLLGALALFAFLLYAISCASDEWKQLLINIFQ